MTELVPTWAFHWFLSLATGVVAGLWLLHDAAYLFRMRRADRTNPLIRDRQFGFVMGIIIATIGVVGTLRFNGVL